MGFLDKIRSKTSAVAREHGDKVKDGLGKAGDVVDKKTGHKHTDKIQSAEDKLGEGIDKLK